MNMEKLEDRRLLAGIQLAGISIDDRFSTNDNVLLSQGDVLNVSPQELEIRFSEEASLDQATLAGGIEILRSGQDGVFEAAFVTTDLNTTGAVVLKFTATQPGEAGEGIILEVTKSDRGVPGNVGVTVDTDLIRIDINENSVANSSATDVLNAINTHPEARATSSFGQGSALQVEFVAVAKGVDGNGLTVAFTNRDFGGPGRPLVTVVDGQVEVELNTNASNPSVASGLVAAINTHPDASLLLTARVAAGSGATPIGTGVSFPDLVLGGSTDVVLNPGYVGLGATDNIAVFRFANTLPDDVYHVNVLGRSGGGRTPVMDVDGNIFLDGMANHGQSFELDLGARVLSVVP
jgi:hypothetical protein